MYSSSIEEHAHHLTIVLEVLRKQQLYPNAKKCEYGKHRVSYLGHIVLADSEAVDPEKVKAMIDWLSPRTLEELRDFLGLTGYYRRFIRHYAMITIPLTQELKNDSFNRNSEAETAFQVLKQAMSSALVLSMPKFTLPFVVEADASGHRLGAVLS